jgi:hypothetical protein
MKTLICIAALIGQITCAMANPATTRFTMRVVDSETGLPVTNAVAKTSFLLKYDPFATRPDEVDRQEISVNSAGLAVFEGETLQHTGGGATIYAEGYYTDGGGFGFTRKSLGFNRWEPWEPVIEVKMRKIKNPVPMIYKKVFRIKPPENGKPIGFDLEKADWAAPYGKGVASDLIFNVSLSESPKKGVAYTLNFNSEADGIQEYLPPDEYARSAFKWPYKAPLEGYQRSMSRFAYYLYPNPDLPSSDLKNPINYIFRVRSRKLENGDISGSYGFIKGEIQIEKENALYFEYWFNPVPNERSLEYSGENLLEKK